MIDFINLKNFKSFKDSGSRLPSFGAIVGKNAAGKTNLVQAILLTKNLITGGDVFRATTNISPIFSEVFNANSNSDEFDLKIKLSNGAKYTLDFSVAELEGDNPIVIKRERLDVDNRLVYLREGDDLKGNDGSTIPLSVDKSKLVIAFYNQGLALAVKKIFSDVYITEQYADIGEAIGSADVNEETLASLLVRLSQNKDLYEKFMTISRKMMPYLASFEELKLHNNVEERQPSEEKYLVLLKEHNLKKQLSTRIISDGDLRTLYLIGMALMRAPHSTLIIEEIENGMHPKRIQELIDHLDTISKINDIQILFTTHSSFVINRLAPQEILLVEKTKDGSRMTLLSESDQSTGIQRMLENGGKVTDYLQNL